MSPSKSYRKSFGKDRRLNSSQEFDRIFKKPTYRFKRFPVRVIGIPSRDNHSRIGIIVGKRALKRAIDRNRIKRIVRESFRIRIPDMPPSHFIVQFLPSSRNGNVDRLDQHRCAEFQEALEAFWRKMKKDLEEESSL